MHIAWWYISVRAFGDPIGWVLPTLRLPQPHFYRAAGMGKHFKTWFSPALLGAILLENFSFQFKSGLDCQESRLYVNLISTKGFPPLD
jgi:hypothetical protein